LGSRLGVKVGGWWFSQGMPDRNLREETLGFVGKTEAGCRSGKSSFAKGPVSRSALSSRNLLHR